MENVIKATISVMQDHGQPPRRNEFNTLVSNPTPFHAEFTITARLFLVKKGQWYQFPQDHYYGGKPWTLQAMETFHGNLNLPTILKIAYELDPRQPTSANLVTGDWLEFTVKVMGDDAPAAHKVYYSFKDGHWLREPGSPDFA